MPAPCDYAVRLTVAAIVEAVVVAMMTRMVPVAEFAVTFVVLKAAIAMIGALRLSGGHGQAQRGNQCKCKQFFG
jgi:Na+/glutamate symporter